MLLLPKVDTENIEYPVFVLTCRIYIVSYLEYSNIQHRVSINLENLVV